MRINDSLEECNQNAHERPVLLHESLCMLLLSFSKTLIGASKHNISALLRDILQKAYETTNVHGLQLYLLDEGSQNLRPFQHDPAPILGIQEGLSLADHMLYQKACLSKERIHIHQTQDIPESYALSRQLLQEQGYATALLIPLVCQGKTTALLEIGQQKKIDPSHILFWETLAQHLGKALAPEASMNLLTNEENEQGTYWKWDVTTGFVYFSRAWLRAAGVSPSEKPASIRSWQRIIHPEDSPRILRITEKLAKGTIQEAQLDYRLLAESGKTYWIHEKARRISTDPHQNQISFESTDHALSCPTDQLKDQFHLLSEASIDIISRKTPENIYELIGLWLSRLTHDAVVVVNAYIPEEQALQTRYISGFSKFMEQASKLLGFHPLHKKFLMQADSDTYQQIISNRLTRVEGGLTELTFGQITPVIARQLEKLTGIESFYACGLFVDHELLGTLTIMTRKDTRLHHAILETFARLASSALQSIKTAQKLQVSNSLLQESAIMARMGFWKLELNTQNLHISPEFGNILKTKKIQENPVLPMADLIHNHVSPEDRMLLEQKLLSYQNNLSNIGFSDQFEWTLVDSLQNRFRIFTRGLVVEEGWVVGISQDISQIKETQKALDQSEVKFQKLLEQSSEGILVLQQDAQIAEWNPRMEEITGITAHQAIGKSFGEVVADILILPQKTHAKKRALLLNQLFTRYFDQEKFPHSKGLTLSISPKAGIKKDLNISSFVFQVGEEKFLCINTQDITLQKIIEKQERLLEVNRNTAEMKQLFLDNMSHEMRTPMMGILGMSEMLQTTSLNPTQQQYLEIIKQSSQELLKLISDIHELTRIDNKELKLRRDYFCLWEIINRSADIFRAAAREKDIQLHIQKFPEIKHCVYSDPFRLQQIMTHLIANAVKFTPPGGRIDILPKLRAINNQNLLAEIHIRDTGIGIPQEFSQILFERFTQADPSATRLYEGAGIGLAICKELVDLLGGEIGFTSRPEGGTDFCIKLKMDRGQICNKACLLI